MESKKTTHQPTSTKKQDAAKFSFKAEHFVSEIKEEMSKVTWTSQEELRVYTKIVVAATFLLGMGIYVIDLVIQAALASLEWFVRLIAG